VPLVPSKVAANSEPELLQAPPRAQAYLRGEALPAPGAGLKAARRRAPPADLPAAPPSEVEAALQAVLGEPRLAAPGARAAPPPRPAAPPPPLGARCDMPEARRRPRPHAQLTPICATERDGAVGCRMPGESGPAVPRL